MIVDPDNVVAEPDEEDNVTTVTDPVGTEPATWGVIKSLYK